MIASFRSCCRPCEPSTNCWRSYRVEAGRDLFGVWLVEVSFGRIGADGRTLRFLAADESHRPKLARHCLHRRASAPRRIGAPYRERERFDPEGWI